MYGVYKAQKITPIWPNEVVMEREGKRWRWKSQGKARKPKWKWTSVCRRCLL